MSTDSASATVTLSARIPGPAQLSSLLDQFAGELRRVEIPGLPTARIGQLSAGLNIALPDTSRWSDIVVPDAAALLRDFPNPADLVGPLRAPVERVRSFLDSDLRGDVARLQASLGAIAPPALDGPQALPENVFKPLGTVAGLLKDSELMRLVVALGEFLGVREIGRLPNEIVAFVARLQTLLQERVGGTLLAVGSVSAAGTLVARLERQVGDAAGWFTLADTELRLQELLAAYGSGPASLAAQMRALNVDDAAQVEALRGRLRAANGAFAAYTTRLTRDLAFSEASLTLIAPAATSQAVRAVEQSLAALDLRPLQALGDSLQGLLRRVSDAFPFKGDMSLDQLRTLVREGLARAKGELGRLDINGVTQVFQDFTRIVTEPFKAIEEFKVEVETLVRDALQTVEDAVRRVELSTIRGLFDQGLAQVEGRLNDLDAVFGAVRGEVEGALNQVKTALDGARNFILDPQDGLKKKIEEIFVALFNLLDQLNIAGAVAQVNRALRPVTVELGRIEFVPIVDATVSVIDTIVDVLGTVAPLLVTDDLKRKLGEATEFLRHIDFDEIARTLNDTFNEILAAVDEEALGRFKEEYDKVRAAINRLDPTPALEALQQQVFDPLIAEVEKFDPARVLRPVRDAFDAARGALDGFDPAATLSFVTNFFDDLTAKVGELSPVRLLAPVEQILAGLRQQITSTLRIDDLLTLLDEAVGPLRELIEGVDVSSLFRALGPGFSDLKQGVMEFDPSALDAPLAAALRGIFVAAGLDIERSGVASMIEAVSAASGGLGARLAALPHPLEEKAAELSRLDVRGALQTLRARHQELRAALAVHASVGPLQLELAAEVGSLDPLPVLAPVGTRLGRVQSAFTGQATALTELARGLGRPVATVDAAAQALGRLLSPLELLKEMLREPVRRLMPDRANGGFKEVLLALLDAIDPTQWRQELEEITIAIQNKGKSVLGEVLIAPLRETLLSLKRTVDLLDISALREAVEDVFRRVEATLRQFDPRPVIEAMGATYRRVLGLFDKLNPAQFIAEIDRLYREDVIGVLRAISPRDLLLPSLRELFAKIGDLLVAFDIELIFRPVLDRLRGLQGQLVGGLERAGASFDRMITTLDSAVGGQVSVGVRVS